MSQEIYLLPEQKISRIETIVGQHPEVAGLQAYEYFRNDSGKQKEEFISGQTAELNLQYPELTLNSITAIKDPMLQALTTLMPGEKNIKSEALYSAVEYRYSELFMMDMARVMISDTHTEEEKSEARKYFKMANEALYGEPKQEIFSALASKKFTPLIEQADNDSAQVSQLRDELRVCLGRIEETEFMTYEPSPELVNRIGVLVHERFDNLVEHIEPEREYDVQTMAEVLEVAITKLGAKDLGWKVTIVPNSSALAVSAHQKQVEIGESRPNISGTELKGKVLHEVGVHAGRSINAERAGWISAAYGQEGYLDFEESFATALEDAYKGEFNEHGENYYIVAGLAYGLDNHEPRNFYEVFEILWRSNALKKLTNGDFSEQQFKKAKSNAFTTCIRMFRGTDTHEKGVVYLKDLAYFNGQERVWEYLRGIENQDDLDIAFAGKLDITRADQLAIAKQITNSIS